METKKLRAAILEDGFVVLPRLLGHRQPEYPDIMQRCERLFHGDFETRVYPDEWHFRHGLTIPNKTKEIVNAWKCDRRIASLVMDARLGRAIAEIMGWPSVRIAQDDVILKPPGGSAVGLHQDSVYISQNFQVCGGAHLKPFEPISVTAWIPLEEVDEENGCLLFAKGSHKWSRNDLNMSQSFHTDETFSARNALSALTNGKSSADVEPMILNPGDVSLHHEDIWHCSNPNRSHVRHRRVIACHYLRGDVEFALERPTYIYGRYKLWKEVILREEFFPTIWPRSEYVAEFLDGSRAKSRL